MPRSISVIACIRIPTFAAAIARRENPTLSVEPLALIDPRRIPPEVCAVSGEAARAGVSVGMTLREAQALCPALHIAEGDPRQRYHAIDDVLALLAEFASGRTPKVEPEPASTPPRKRRRAAQPMPGLADDPLIGYLDLGRLKADEGLEVAHHIHQALRQHLVLGPMVALAAGKFTARVAALSLGSNEIAMIPKRQSAAFLAPYPVTLLPVDAETVRQLHLLGLRTLGQLAGLPASAMLNRFGKAGVAIHRLAGGADTSPILPYKPRIIERQTRQLDGPVGDHRALGPIIDSLTVTLVNRLQEAGRTAREVDVKVVQDDGRAHAHGIALRRPTSSPKHIARTAKDLLAALPVTDGIVAIELTLTGIVPAAPRQLSLFEREPIGAERLPEILAQLVARYGDETFFWVSADDPDARLLEARYRLRKVDDDAEWR
jgi:nucleotidyltransferase/DNA polymerase involved in DNA repair